MCNDQLISTLSNQALLSIINIAYSGDGKTIFALPNLMGRESIYPGHGLGHLALVSLKNNSNNVPHHKSLLK